MNKPWEKAKRQIAASLALISITLGAITVILWPLSYATGVQVSVRNGAGRRYALTTVPGQFGLSTVVGEPRSMSINMASQSFSGTTVSAPRDMMHWFWVRPTGSPFNFSSAQGVDTIAYPEVNASFASKYKTTFVPMWLVAIICFAGPVGWWRARKRRQYRMENDLCVYCGSDMTSSPYRCPACGKEQQW